MLNCGGYTPNVCADFCNVAILHCPVSHASATPVPTIKTVFGIPLINGFFIFCARKIKNKGITLTNGVSNTVTNPFNDNHTNAPAAMFPIRAALGIHFIRSLLTNPPAISMILDGVTTVLSSLTGSPFPTTVYYGHPGWKKVGTRSGYSLMMAVVYLSCFFGLPLLILDIIPYEVIIVLLVLVGLNVTSDVVDNMEKEYSGVIFISLFPILAQYIVSAVSDTSVISHAFEVLSYGAFASSLLYSVWLAYIYKKDFKKAGYTAIVLAGLSLIGFIHTETLCWLSKTGKEFGIIYLMIGAICLLVGKMDRE